MSQQISVKRKNPRNGTEERLELNVVRTWASPAGVIRLLADGAYVQADGSPPASPRLLDVIADRNQHAAAMAWWQRCGEEIARVFYGEREQAIGARAAAVEAAAARLEVKYFRIPAAGGDREGPFSWAEAFAEAPVWWGVVDMTMVNSWVYVREGVSTEMVAGVAALDVHGPERPGTVGGAQLPEMDPLTPVVVTIFKSAAARTPSRRFSGPYQQAAADARQWLAGKDAGEYAGARWEVIPVTEQDGMTGTDAGVKIDPDVPVQDGPAETI
jgi:hypothetical protein